jgi:hypothetical protein
MHSPDPTLKIVETVALVSGSGGVVSIPASAAAQLSSQLPLFVGECSGSSDFFWFVLTAETGERLHVYALSLAGADATLCLLSRHCAATPLFSLLAALARHPAPLLPLLLSLLQPPPGLRLQVSLPSELEPPVAFVAPPAGFPPTADPLHWEVILALGISPLLSVMHALLLERPILLISENVPLLSTAIAALLRLCFPLTWEATLVPVLPEVRVPVLKEA